LFEVCYDQALTLSSVFKDEQEKRQRLADTAQKALDDPTITEVHEAPEKKA
jgi:hypothetical protein